MEIQDLIRAFWRRKWIILITTILTGTMSFVLLKYKSEEYKSEARIATGFTITDRVALSDDMKDFRNAEVKFSNLLELMNSPISFDLLTYRLLLHDLESPTGNFRQPRDVSNEDEENIIIRIKELAIKKLEDLTSGEGQGQDIYTLHTREEVGMVKAILASKLNNLEPMNPGEEDFEFVRQFFLEYGYEPEDIREDLYISRLPTSDFIQVGFISENKNLSAYVANTFCREFMRYYSSLNGEYSTESVAFLKQVADEKKEELDDKLEILKRFKSSGSLLQLDQDNGSREGQLVDMEGRRDEIRSRLKELRLVIARLNQDIANASTPGNLNQEIVDLQAQIDAMNSSYIAGGASSRTLSDSLTFLRANLRRLVSTLDAPVSGLSVKELQEKLKDADIDYEVEQNRLSMAESKIRELRYGLSNQNSKETKVTAIQNEVDLATKEYMEVANKYNEARNRLASGNSLRLVQLAKPAVKPISTENIYIVGLASLSGMALAFFVIILKEITDDSIRSLSRLRTMIQMPIVGMINWVNINGKDINHLFQNDTRKARLEIYKSSLRQIRYQIESMNAKVFLFTSLKPKVGKTFVIFSVAYALSLLKKRVLIIDTNFKSSSLTRIYGMGHPDIKVIKRKMVPARPVMAEVMGNGTVQTREKSLESGSFDLVSPSMYEDIFFVGNTGTSNSSPAELLSPRDFNAFISLMAEQFDYVFLEGPALNDYSDSKELVGYVEKVITVFSASSTIDPMDQHTMQYIQSLGRKSGGAILNQVNDKDMK